MRIFNYLGKYIINNSNRIKSLFKIKTNIYMIIPVRCFTCGKIIGDLWAEYKKRIESGEDSEKVLDSLGLDRYCCRTVFVTHIDMMKEIAQFKV